MTIKTSQMTIVPEFDGQQLFNELISIFTVPAHKSIYETIVFETQDHYIRKIRFNKTSETKDTFNAN